MDEQRHWHRLFGMVWHDFFTGQPVTVEVEKDLSLKQQLLDVVLIRADGPLTVALPDGFETFGRHNLISFKSFQEALDGWALNEFLGHYVNYRKQASPSMRELLPEDDFRLFAVCARYPQGLAREVPLTAVREGVYEVRHFSGTLRVIVVGQLPQQVPNATVGFFSAVQEMRGYAARTYTPRSKEGSRLLLQLFEGFAREGLDMPYTVEQMMREVEERVLSEASAEQLLKHVPVEKRVAGLSAEDLLNAVPPEIREELRRRLQAETGGERQAP